MDRCPSVVPRSIGDGGLIVPVVVDAENDVANRMPPPPILRDEDDAIKATRNGRGDLILCDGCCNGAAESALRVYYLSLGSRTTLSTHTKNTPCAEGYFGGKMAETSPPRSFTHVKGVGDWDGGMYAQAIGGAVIFCIRNEYTT